MAGYLDDFENLLKFYPQDPQLVAKMLTIWRSELATKLKQNISKINSIINLGQLKILLEEIKKGNINKSQIRPIFNDLMKGILLKDIIVKKMKSPDNIEEKIMKIIKEKPGLSLKAYMGLIMKEFRGRISGKEVKEIIERFVR